MEKYLIKCCAPTLAGKKVGNIFSVSKNEINLNEISLWNLKLNHLNIEIRILKESDEKYIIYVFNRILLENLLRNKSHQTFLSTYLYSDFNLNSTLEHLKSRLGGSDEFPHEIGIFLGYPLCDVIGFIKYKGKYFKKSGIWKVYGNTKQCDEIFKDFHKCKNCFIYLYEQGYKTIDIIKKFNGGINYEESSSSILVRNR